MGRRDDDCPVTTKQAVLRAERVCARRALRSAQTSNEAGPANAGPAKWSRGDLNPSADAISKPLLRACPSFLFSSRHSADGSVCSGQGIRKSLVPPQHASLGEPARFLTESGPIGREAGSPRCLIRLRERTACWQFWFCILFTWQACSTARDVKPSLPGRFRIGPVA